MVVLLRLRLRTRVDGAGGGKLAGGHPAIDLLLGLLEGFLGGSAVLEEEEAVALGFSGGLVDDDVAVLDLAVLGEEGADLVGGGLPAEAVDEDLAVGGVAVCDAVDLAEEGGVGGGGGAEEIDQLLLAEGF